MRGSPRIIGGLIGAAAALLVLGFRSGGVRTPGRMISECDGPIRELVIHYVAGDTIALPVYAQFLPLLPADVTVTVVCPDQPAFDELLRKIGPVKCRISPLVVNHPMTVWSRDRWVALEPGNGSEIVTLLAPADEEGAGIWPQRAGDAQVANDIARLMSHRVRSRRLSIFFDGGDLLADGSNVFVNPAVRSRNIGRTTDDPDALRSLLQRELGLPVILLDPAPDHHVGMFMMAAGDDTMLVGDPSMAAGLYDPSDLPDRPDGVGTTRGRESLMSKQRLPTPLISTAHSVGLPELLGGVDRSEATQRTFDSVATQVAAAGYRVVRIPVLPSKNGKTYITYVNAITDFRDGRKIVYMPVYPTAAELNELAAQVWRGLGYQVHPIDVASCYEHFGTLHCLVNVLRRG